MFNIKLETLLRMINDIEVGISKNTSSEILGGILVSATTSCLKLTTSSLDITVISKCTSPMDYECLKEHEFVILDGDTFSKFIKKFRDVQGLISFEEKGNNLILSYKKSKVEFVIVNSDNYPTIPTFNETELTQVQSNIFLDLIRRTVPFVSQDNTRPVLGGVCVDIEANTIRAVSIDGYRLSLSQESTSSEHEDKLRVIVPAHCLSKVPKVFISDDILNLSFDNNHLKIIGSYSEMMIRLLDGEFIEYIQLLPDKFSSIVDINKDDFKLALERATLIAKDTSTVKLNISKNNIYIQSTTSSNKIDEEIECNNTGADLEIAFNSRYLLDAIKVINSSSLKLKFNSGTNPLIIEPSEENFLHLVLPVRLVS